MRLISRRDQPFEDQHSGTRLGGGLDRAENAPAVFVAPVVQDPAEYVDVRRRHGCEAVACDELHAVAEPGRGFRGACGLDRRGQVQDDAAPRRIVVPAERVGQRLAVGSADVGDRPPGREPVAGEHAGARGGAQRRHGLAEQARAGRIGGEPVEIGHAVVLLDRGLAGAQGVPQLADHGRTSPVDRRLRASRIVEPRRRPFGCLVPCQRFRRKLRRGLIS